MSYESQDTESVEAEGQGLVVTTQADLLHIFDLIKTTSRVEGAVDSAIQIVPEEQRGLLRASLTPMLEQMGASVIDLQHLFLSQLPSVNDIITTYGGQYGSHVDSATYGVTEGASSPYTPHNEFTESFDDNQTQQVSETMGQTNDSVLEAFEDTYNPQPVNVATDDDDQTNEDVQVDDTKSTDNVTDDVLSIFDDPVPASSTPDTVVTSTDMVLADVARTTLPQQGNMSIYKELVEGADISAKNHLPDLSIPLDDSDVDDAYNEAVNETDEPVELDETDEMDNEDAYDDVDHPMDDDSFEADSVQIGADDELEFDGDSGSDGLEFDTPPEPIN